MTKGKVVYVLFPFSDLTGAKRRPALILAVEAPDVTLAFITSQLHQQRAHDVLLQPSAVNGLTLPSLVRVAKLASVSQRHVLGYVGELTPAELQQVNQGLRAALQLDEAAAPTLPTWLQLGC